MPPRAEPQAWHLDKKVPIALILAVLVQTAGVAFWAASLQRDTAEHARRILALEAADARMGDDARRISEALARVDERLQAQTAIMRRVEDAVSRQGQAR